MAAPNPIVLIAAMAKNRVIGDRGQLPWRLPRDMQWFRQQTMGKPIIMGRKTCESLPKSLPGRRNIVVSRQPDFRAEGFEIAASLDDAIRQASQSYEGEVMIIGGETLYHQTLSQASQLCLTLVDDLSKGDAFFPDYDESSWQTVFKEWHPADNKNPFGVVFLKLERATAECK